MKKKVIRLTESQLVSIVKRVIKEEKEASVKTKYGTVRLTYDDMFNEWEYSFTWTKNGVKHGMTDGGFSSKEEAVRAFEKVYEDEKSR